MSTPWNNQLVSLVIVTAPAGAYAGIFVYSPAPGTGNLIGSWAASAGTDPYGNAYPQGLSVTVGSISGSTFTGTNFIINPSGMFFYSGTPALGNLATSIAATAGTDSFGNVYPAGVGIEQAGLVLFNQSSAPAATSGAGTIYMGSTGRLRYINPAGADMVLDRCTIDTTNHSMTTQTLPTQMSAFLNYLANEGQVGSEYEVMIDGTFTGPTGAASSVFTFDLFKNSGTFGVGSSVSVGAVVVQQSNLVYAFNVLFKMILNATGTAANVNIIAVGTVSEKGVNAGNSQTFTTLNNVQVTATFNTTVNNTLGIFCNWSSTTGTGHSAITYQTKLTRRN